MTVWIIYYTGTTFGDEIASLAEEKTGYRLRGSKQEDGHNANSDEGHLGSAQDAKKEEAKESEVKPEDSISFLTNNGAGSALWEGLLQTFQITDENTTYEASAEKSKKGGPFPSLQTRKSDMMVKDNSPEIINENSTDEEFTRQVLPSRENLNVSSNLDVVLLLNETRSQNETNSLDHNQTSFSTSKTFVEGDTNQTAQNPESYWPKSEDDNVDKMLEELASLNLTTEEILASSVDNNQNASSYSDKTISEEDATLFGNDCNHIGQKEELSTDQSEETTGSDMERESNTTESENNATFEDSQHMLIHQKVGGYLTNGMRTTGEADSPKNQEIAQLQIQTLAANETQPEEANQLPGVKWEGSTQTWEQILEAPMIENTTAVVDIRQAVDSASPDENFNESVQDDTGVPMLPQRVESPLAMMQETTVVEKSNYDPPQSLMGTVGGYVNNVLTSLGSYPNTISGGSQEQIDLSARQKARSETGSIISRVNEYIGSLWQAPGNLNQYHLTPTGQMPKSSDYTGSLWLAPGNVEQYHLASSTDVAKDFAGTASSDSEMEDYTHRTESQSILSSVPHAITELLTQRGQRRLEQPQLMSPYENLSSTALTEFVNNHVHYQKLVSVGENLPFQPSSQTPYFWHIHKSGGSSMKHMMTCMGLTQTRRGSDPACSDTDENIHVCPLEWGNVVNADASSPSGIKRIQRIGLFHLNLETLVVDTSRIYEALHIFTPQHRGRLFVVLRDPVERAISKYYYNRIATWERNYKEEIANMTLIEYAKSRHCIDNWITRRLVHKMNPEQVVTEGDLRLAKEILRQKALILLTQAMDESVFRLAQYFGWKLTGYQRWCIDKFAKHDPINQNPHPIPSRDSPEWAAVREKQLLDLELYRFAMTLYYEQQGPFLLSKFGPLQVPAPEAPPEEMTNAAQEVSAVST
jgi:hypothetical protein